VSTARKADETKAPAEAFDMTRAMAVMERARQGDWACIQDVWALLEADPPAATWLFGGDVAWNLKFTMVQRVAGKNLGAQEALLRRVDSVEEELAGPNPTAIERLLAERAAICWLDAHMTDLMLCQGEDLTIAHADYLGRRQERATKRFVAILRTLAIVKKLAVPVLRPERPTVSTKPRTSAGASVPSERKSNPRATSVPCTCRQDLRRTQIRESLIS
jgi:hypothetical protein